MRIVYLVSLFPCWSETFIVRELRQLIDSGVDVRIVSLKFPSERMVQADAQALLTKVVYPARGLRAVRRVAAELARSRGRLVVDVARIAWALRHAPVDALKTLVVLWRALSIAEDIRYFAPQHLHAHWATFPSTAAMLLSKLLGRSFSFTSHAHDIFVNDHMMRAKLAAAEFGVTISEYNRRHLHSLGPEVAGARLHVIRCGVMLDEFGFVESARDRTHIVAVGRLDEIKGFRHLVDACALLVQQGHAFRCTIVGEGPLRGELEQQVRALGLADRIELPGAKPQAQVAALIRQAGVFALPCVVARTGDRDGIPVALMEAMASGLPVVSTRVSGIPELIEHDATGLLAEPGDAGSLASALARLLEDAALGRALARAARHKVERDFDARKEAVKLLGEFRRGLACESPR